MDVENLFNVSLTVFLYSPLTLLIKDIDLQSFFSEFQIALVGMVKPPSPLEVMPFDSDALCVVSISNFVYQDVLTLCRI
jgi:hypothetical protein